MNRPSVEVFTDDQITSRVLDILRDAKKHVTLVSPYNKFWTHLRNELQRTVTRDVRVDFIYRNGERSEDTNWLEDLGVRVHAVENLHAKIYLNESSVLVTSMNLLESSSKNSMEICISVNDKKEQKDVRGYVKTLLLIAQRADEGKKTSARTGQLPGQDSKASVRFRRPLQVPLRDTRWTSTCTAFTEIQGSGILYSKTRAWSPEKGCSRQAFNWRADDASRAAMYPM